MNIAVFFGGKSCEHNVSVATGVMTANALLRHGHKVYCVYMDRQNRMLSSKKFFSIDQFKRKRVRGFRVSLKCGDNRLRFPFKRVRVDCAVLCNHGKNGEDGSLQGLLQLSGIPYTGSNILGSAVGMDKSVMKKLFHAAKIPTVKSVVAYKHTPLHVIAENAEKKLGFPVIVKPANLGSSIGIGVAHDSEELFYALSVAFEWDTTAIIERAVKSFTELNCAVLGDRDKMETSVIEKPVSAGEFLSYDDKYHGGAKLSLSDRTADIPSEIRERVIDLSKRAFCACSCSGVARVDFLLDNDTGKLYANEINTIPGSLAAYLFPDIPHHELIGKLIDLAVKRFDEENRLRFTYEDSSFCRKYK